jgi:hypothetical protein
VIRADFFRADAPEQVVGVAEWNGQRAVVESDDEAVRSLLVRVFHASQVVTGSMPVGETVLEPGGQAWFRAAARVRGEREGLKVRFVIDRPGGWDPAADPQTYGWGGAKPSSPHER